MATVRPCLTAPVRCVRRNASGVLAPHQNMVQPTRNTLVEISCLMLDVGKPGQFQPPC
ncbi:MAG: hypothetical protein VXZ84_10415 [Planctomycetota bacterium]|nr:hypothetical protein [Planctomycetota bacterium]